MEHKIHMIQIIYTFNIILREQKVPKKNSNKKQSVEPKSLKVVIYDHVSV